MQFSSSSVFITLIMVILMGALLSLLLHQKKHYIFFRSDLLILLALIILVRLLLPLELPFTYSIYAKALMNPIQTILLTEITNHLNVFELFCMIWIIGSLISLFLYLRKIYISKRVLKRIERTAQKDTVSSFIKTDVLQDHPVWMSDLVSSCMVVGTKGIILLPRYKFSKAELSVILLHEIQHIQNHDIYIKQFCNILKIIYWWFLPIYWLDHNINLSLEIRADAKATQKLSQNDILQYAHTLVDVEDKTLSTAMNRSLFVASNYFIWESSHVLQYRIHYLLRSHFKAKTNKLLLISLILLPFLSNAIILEASFDYPYPNDGTFSEEELVNEGYLIENKDGTYSLSYHGETSIVNDPTSLIDLGIKITSDPSEDKTAH